MEAYVDTAPEVAAWLEDNSPVEFETLRGMSDYHPEHPGGKQEGRSLECTLFPFADLGYWAHRVTVGWQLTGEITMSESSLGRKAPDGVPREELDRRKLRDDAAQARRWSGACSGAVSTTACTRRSGVAGCGCWSAPAG